MVLYLHYIYASCIGVCSRVTYIFRSNFLAAPEYKQLRTLLQNNLLTHCMMHIGRTIKKAISGQQFSIYITEKKQLFKSLQTHRDPRAVIK